MAWIAATWTVLKDNHDIEAAANFAGSYNSDPHKFCVTQSAVFSGLNLAIFSVSKLRLEVEAASGNLDAIRVLDLRKDSNFT